MTPINCLEIQGIYAPTFSASRALLWNSDKVADTSHFTDLNGDGLNDADVTLPGYVIIGAGIAYRVRE